MYAEAIYARMKLVWGKLAEQRADDLSLGKVVVHFEITADGQTENLKIMSNTGNRALGELGISTIRETHLPRSRQRFCASCLASASSSTVNSP